MESLKKLYDDLLSNYPSVILELFNTTHGRLTSKYFNFPSVGICKPLAERKMDIKRLAGPTLRRPESVCFPRGINQTTLLESDPAINELLITTILQFDPDLGIHFNPIIGVTCSGISYEHQPSTLSSPLKFAHLIPAKYVIFTEKETDITTIDKGTPEYLAQVGTVRTLTVTNNFIITFMTQIIEVLSLAGYHFDFVHGHLTHRQLSFKTTEGDNFKVIICDLQSSSLTYMHRGEELIRLIPTPDVNPIYARLASEIKLQDSPNHTYRLQPQSFWETSFKKLRAPYYRSFDFYTLMMSILSIEYMFVSIFGNHLFKAIFFDSLFIPEEQSQAYIAIRKWVLRGTEPTFDEIVNMLKGFTLRCDALDITRKRLEKTILL